MRKNKRKSVEDNSPSFKYIYGSIPQEELKINHSYWCTGWFEEYICNSICSVKTIKHIVIPFVILKQKRDYFITQTDNNDILEYDAHNLLYSTRLKEVKFFNDRLSAIRYYENEVLKNDF